MTTATIRVSMHTRDMLADQARAQGISIAALLAELAEERRRAAVWESERAAAKRDATNPEAVRESLEWDQAVLDDRA